MNKENVIKALKKGVINLGSLPENLRKDKEVVLVAVEHINYSFTYVDQYLCGDKDVVRAMCKYDTNAPTMFHRVSEDLKNDKDFILELLNDGCNIFKSIGDELIKDRDVTNQALLVTPLNYKYIDESLRLDKDLLLENIKKYGETFGLANKEFRNNKEIALFAIDYCKDVFIHIDDEILLNNDDLINKQLALKQSIKNISIDRLKDKEFMLKVLAINGLEYSSIQCEDLRNDWDIIKAAINGGHRYIMYFLKPDVISDTRLLTKILELMYSHDYIEDYLSVEYRHQMIQIFKNNDYMFEFNNVSKMKFHDYIKIKTDALDLVFPKMLGKLMKEDMSSSKVKGNIVKF